MKIRHSLVTDNYLAAEEIQNQDWQYFIKWVIEVCKLSDVTIRPDEEFLLSTIENVTVAKRVYTMIFNTVARNFNLTVSNLPYGRIGDISDDFSIKNYPYRDSLTNLNDWISYYYLYGKFPGSEEFINVPFVNKLGFVKTKTNLSPADLYKTVSQFAYGEFMKNLTYQALSQENDDIFLSFDFATDLAHSIVNDLADVENEEGKMASEISDQISDKLDIEFETVESPSMQIQLGEEPKICQEPIPASTPLTEKRY